MIAEITKDQAFTDHGHCKGFSGAVFRHLQKMGMPGLERQYDKGDYVWMPGSRADRIYFLRQGQVTLVRDNPQGNQIILRVVNAGEPFGELCFCADAGGHRPEAARAVLDSSVVEVSFQDFILLLRQNEEALTALLFTFCERITELARRVEVMSFRGAEDRLGRLLLLLLGTPRGQRLDDQPHHRAIDISHDELAQTAAMSRSHVTVTMGKFRRKGLVDYSRDRPLVVNVRALESYLKENYTA